MGQFYNKFLVFKMGDILQLIPNGNLPKLRDILRKEYPENIHVFNFVDTTIQVKKKFPKLDCINIYSPNGDFSDGTFVAVIQMNCYDILIYTMDKTLKRLETALKETKLINYNNKPIFCAMFQTYFDMANRLQEKVGNYFFHHVPSNVWTYSKEKALQYQYSIPDDLYLAPLNQTHSVIMNEVWPHKYKDSDKYLAKMIELNGAVGLFTKINDELCAWVLKNYFGGLGMLQVAEKHKRKGYGTLITKIFSKMIAEQDGYDISGFIVVDNAASQGMFTRLGFEKGSPVVWLLPDDL